VEPSQKPLRVKRPRKDAPLVDSPMRQASESPGPRDPSHAGGGVSSSAQDYPFVSVPADQAALYMGGGGGVGTGKMTSKGGNGNGNGGGSRNYNYRSRGGPKRPPNAYMMWVVPPPPPPPPLLADK
jgi:non-histone protein 10